MRRSLLVGIVALLGCEPGIGLQDAGDGSGGGSATTGGGSATTGGGDAATGGGSTTTGGGGAAVGGGSATTGGGAAVGGGSATTGGGDAAVGGGSATTGGGTSTMGGGVATGGGSGTFNFDALPEGDLAATPTVSKEIIRMPAGDAPASDSETQLLPGTPVGTIAWRWRVWPSDLPGAIDSPSQRYAARVFESTQQSPTFTCPASRASYDVELTFSDGSTRSSYRFRRLIVCTLPRTAAGRPVINLNLAAGSSSTNCDGRIGGNVVQPGTLVRISGAITRSWAFYNLTGTAAAPIHLINAGTVTNTNANRLLHCYNCQHVIIDGRGDDAVPFGFVLSNDTTNASQAVLFKTHKDNTCPNSELKGLDDLEVFGVRVANNRTDAWTGGGAGLEINTRGEPLPDGGAISRDTNWEVRGDAATGRPGVMIHHNQIEETYVEGFYIGFTVDWDSPTYDDVVTPYQMRGVKLFRNTLRSTGKDGLQVCNSRGLELHDNVVSEVARRNLAGDQSSLQLNSGDEGAVFANTFSDGRGLNMQSGCTGDDLFFYANVVRRGVEAPGNSLYFKAGITADVHAHFFMNTWDLNGDDFFELNTTDPGCFADNGALAGVYIANNLFVMPDAGVMLAGNSASTAVTTPNLRRNSLTAADLCLQSDLSVCPTSAARAQTGVSLNSLGVITNSATLPLGAYTDRTGRVRAEPRGYGAFQ